MFKLIYKEKGISSFRAIANFAKENNIKKIGHTGTLDPLATGLLMVATDCDTKLISYITNKDKTYIAEATFNLESDTYDIEGKILHIYKEEITLTKIEKIIPLFLGKIKQVPPIFSAKKINGQKAYELARKNKSITLKPNDVEIYYLNIISFLDNKLLFEVSVSSGTYIRSLIHDLGKALNSGAIMTGLERTIIHGIHKDDLNSEIKVEELIDLPFLEISDYLLKKLITGQETIINQENNKYVIFFKLKNNIIGIIEIKNNIVTERKIFGNRLGINNV